VNLENRFAPYSPPNTNLVEQLRYWSVALPEKIAFRFLGRGDDEHGELSYSQLDTRARAIAAKLLSLGMAGQRALMLYPPGLDFVAAFFGCHYAGVIPVPANPPRRNRNFDRIHSIAGDAQAEIVLGVQPVIARCASMIRSPGLGRITYLPTEQISDELALDWVKPKIDPDQLGLIQYTSGSTGVPKGVMLTHRNINANCAMITHAFGTTHSSAKGVSWLPTYHDMGLIGGVLNPVFCGGEMTLMSPVTFLTRPLRWLQAISDYKAVISGGPNFAYRWCTMKIRPDECVDLDLSTWEVAFNGAEPVRADVLEEFSRKFEPYGFRHSSHYPCYGMAETALIVTGGDKNQPPVIRSFSKSMLAEYRVQPVESDHPEAHRLVGCGKVIPSEEVIIVHPENRTRQAEDQIGEIWIHSPSSGLGYWNREEESTAVFHSRLADKDGKNYVRSGDLGFFRDGELFVTGRLKDMIIIRGVNRYPQDIEATVENCARRLRSGGAAAFAIDHWDREHLVVVCEVERQRGSNWNPLLEKIRSAVIADHELPPDAIVLVRHNSVPKTSSGKVQRHACRQQYISGTLQAVAQWSAWENSQVVTKSTAAAADSEVNGQVDTAADPEVVQVVLATIEKVARDRARNLTIDTNIVLDLGLDSLERLEIARELEKTYGARFPEEVLQEIETVREVAEAIQAHFGHRVARNIVPTVRDERSSVPDTVPESYYVLEKMPEYLRLKRTAEFIEKTGIRNPYFSVHQGRIADTTVIDGRELISYSSYNYLGLSGHPEVNQAAKNAIDQFGTSASASRIVSGEKTIHKQLEFELAEFLDVEDVITFPGGHATNESVIGHLVGSGDLIIHDSLAHNSIIQGAELSGARRRPFAHNDWEQLDKILKEIRRDYRRVLIAVEGLYSMDGDFPELPRFVEIKNQHKAWLYLDEAHSIGTMGKTGRGLAEVYGVSRADVECWMGTLSKSFGSCGGFIGGSASLIEYLRYTTPGFVFAAAMPPANVGAALGALRMLKKHPELVSRLQHNSALFLSLAREAGLDTGMCQGTPIIPIITRSSLRALQLAESLFQNGINAQPILHPAVAEEETRIRVFMTASHSENQIRESVDTIAREWSAIVGRIPNRLVET
jgi:8-amino-7-oxononanoate synthase/acyl carrier protein